MRRIKVYATKSQWIDPVTNAITVQPTGRMRLVTNGNDEPVYAAWLGTVAGKDTQFVYRGGNTIIAQHDGGIINKSSYVKRSFSFADIGQVPTSLTDTAQWEVTYTDAVYQNIYRYPLSLKDALGRTTSWERNLARHTTKTTFPDATTHTTTLNFWQEPTVEIDRLGRRTRAGFGNRFMQSRSVDKIHDHEKRISIQLVIDQFDHIAMPQIGQLHHL